MLITLGVGSLLLAGLWSLLGMYTRLFDAGKTKAGNMQLVTGLTQQLADDLRGAVNDVSPPLSGVSHPMHRFGLFGDAHCLQVDVLQTVWPEVATRAEAERSDDVMDGTLVHQAHELRTVRYSFVASATVGDSGKDVHPGLTRREFDFESPHETGNAAMDAFQESPAAAESPDGDSPQELSPRELSLLESLPADGKDNSTTWVPEIVRLEFRYFDGTTWTSTWNSVERRALPAAVEVVFDFRYRDDLPQPATATGKSSTSDAASAATDAGVEPVVPRGVMTRRVVFELPGSPLQISLAPPPPVRERAASIRGPAAEEMSLPSPAESLIDPGEEFPDQNVLLSQGDDDPEAANSSRSRFRVWRRSTERAGAASRPAPQASPDQWIRQ
jgi:hypothetical protein